jgi:GNAT superfamily N-acetyltransferase
MGWAGGRAAVAIRQTGPEDLPALGNFFAGLSAHTRYLRFFGPVTPGTALLRTLCGAADNVDALVAVRGGVIVGHAMAIDRTESHNSPGPRSTRVADIGLVVDDAWQGRGVGAALMRALLTGAQARGVTTLEMDILDGNRRVLAMVTGHWPAARVEHNSDGFAIRVRLPQAGSKPTEIAPHVAIGARAAEATRNTRTACLSEGVCTGTQSRAVPRPGPRS